MDILHTLFYVPTFNLMIVLANLFAGNIGWAIVGIAAISKIITIPLTRGQIDSAEKNKKLQVEMNAVKKQYKHNQEKQTQELAKIQAKALPGQLSGCLSIIIFLVLFIQIRGVIFDLVNQGYHSFNQVAIVDTLKKQEDSIELKVAEPLAVGKHNIVVSLEATNGSKLEQTFEFEVVADKAQRQSEIKLEQLTKSDQQKQDEQNLEAAQSAVARAADMSVFSKLLSENTVDVAVNQFLVFTTESKKAILLTETEPTFTFFMRAPSNQQLVREATNIKLDGVDVTPIALISPQGDKLNLDFFGMNLAKVAADFNLTDFGTTMPYIVVALLSAVAQYFVTTLYSGLSPSASPAKKQEEKDGKDKKKDDKKDDKEEPDFAQIMGESTKQMNYIFPIMTMMMGLGYLGGAALIPSGVTLFWTGQNGFVIIQQLITERKKVIAGIKDKISKIQTRFKK